MTIISIYYQLSVFYFYYSFIVPKSFVMCELYQLYKKKKTFSEGIYLMVYNIQWNLWIADTLGHQYSIFYSEGTYFWNV